MQEKQDDLITHEGRTATFLYNKNLAGVVIVQSILGDEIEVDGDDLLTFVAEAYVRPRLIKCVEETDAKELLLNQLDPLD
jgi:hypothetical protein